MKSFERKQVLALVALAMATAGLAHGQTTSADTLRLQQQEIVRRQELVFSAMQSISEGEKAEQAKDYEGAATRYRFALSNLGTAPTTAGARKRAGDGLIRVNQALYAERIKEGKVDEARKLLVENQAIDPKNVFADKEIKRIDKVRKDPTDTTFLPNPAVNEAFKKDVDTVQLFLAQAEQFRRTGQLDEADKRYRKVLGIDPYSEAARKGLEQIQKEKTSYYRIADDANRQKRLTETVSRWSQPERRDSFVNGTEGPAVPITRSNKFQISQKLRTIIIPSLDFNDASIEDAATFFAAKSKDLDPERIGVNFILKPEASGAAARKFTLTLKNIPLGEALRYVTQLANVKFKVDEFAVTIVPLAETTDVLLRRDFIVPPTFFTTTSTSDTTTAAAGAGGDRRPGLAVRPVAGGGGTDETKQQLMDKGVEFPAGSAAVYTYDGRLQVVNTQAQLDLIEELVNAETGATQIVEIETKIIEINQNDLNDITFNWTLTPVTGVATTPSFTSALRGSQAISVGSLDQLLFNTGIPVPNSVKIQGLLDNYTFRAVLIALAQKKSTDLLSAPIIRVKSGEEAKLDISRTFFFPTAFEPPSTITPPASINSASTVVADPGVVPAFPSEFQSKPIGVTLAVRPQVGADKRTISMVLVPTVTDFEGFINYGDPISVSGVQLTANTINQPVFNTRKIRTDVFVRDGYTVVLGGLIRDDVQTVNDKIPILGDIPFVGRFFSSKATQSIKKNLLIFVSGRILSPDGEPFNQLEAASADTAPVAAR